MSNERFICVNNQGYPAALELFATYKTIPDEHAEKRGLIRVIDESGEDYLYPKSRFVSVDITPDEFALLSKEAQRALAKHTPFYVDNVDPLTGREFSAQA